MFWFGRFFVVVFFGLHCGQMLGPLRSMMTTSWWLAATELRNSCRIGGDVMLYAPRHDVRRVHVKGLDGKNDD